MNSSASSEKPRHRTTFSKVSVKDDRSGGQNNPSSVDDDFEPLAGKVFVTNASGGYFNHRKRQGRDSISRLQRSVFNRSFTNPKASNNRRTQSFSIPFPSKKSSQFQLTGGVGFNIDSCMG